MAVHVTVGRGLTAPQGKLLELQDDPVVGLARLFESQPAAVESWWSPHQWQGDRRSSSGWAGASGVGVDVDYHDADGKHAPIPDELAAWALAAAKAGSLPGNLFHTTPRGFRVVFVFPELCTDPERFRAAALEAGQRVATALKKHAPKADLRVDEGVLQDLARLLFSPNAIVKGVERAAQVVIGNPFPVSVDELAPVPDVAWSVVELPGSQTIADAVRKYNADHARTFPTGRGSCPICGHNGCFGQLKDDPTKWSCFSANHAGGGRRGAGCFVGDVLDIDAHLAGLQPIDVLRRDGYLAPRDSAPVASSAPSAPTPLQVEEDDNVVPVGPTRSITKSYASACYVLRDAAMRELVMGPGALEFNEQSLMPTLDRRPVTEEQISALRERCENLLRTKRGRGLEFSRETLEQAVMQVARERPFHPVREYLRGLKWDGIERIDHIADDILCVAPTPLQRSILRKWMISAVARPLRPGCKVDNVLILVGGQGVKKSTFFYTLAGGDSYFRDSMMDLASKDAYQMLRGAWIFEWAELESMARSRETATTKAFITSRVDTYRPAYARTVQEHPRTCIIVGSTNDDRFLADPTGNRRFWIVPAANRINLELLEHNRDQLWAEAVLAFNAGEEWWLGDEQERELTEIQDGYLLRDPWEDTVVSYVEAQLEQGQVVTTANILAGAIEKRPAQQEKGDEMRIGAILRRAGLHRAMVRDSFGKRVRGWERDPKWRGRPDLESRSGNPNGGGQAC